MSILLKQANLLLPEESHGDVRIEGDRIVEIAPTLTPHVSEQVIDLNGSYLMPGFIDVHVHFRDPGFLEKESLETGLEAAVRGGYTSVACMPNTKPTADHPETISDMVEKAKSLALSRLYPVAAISYGLKGEELTDFAALKAAGAWALSDDGRGVQNSGMMYQAMKEAAALEMPILAHCEDEGMLEPGGCVHDGNFARKYQLTGISSLSESLQVARDIQLAGATGAHYHVCHCSAWESIRAIADGKRHGVHVTAEVTPHHLLLTDDDIPGLDANYKMNPPLRSSEDREALVHALQTGVLDMIATDHAPHTVAEKERGMERAPFGIVGLETAFPLLYTYLVKPGYLTLRELVERMSTQPAEIFGFAGGRIAPGAVADLTVVNLNETYTIQPSTFASKGRNTPFTGWKVEGRVTHTFVGGRLAWLEEGSR
ncbi:dihydroorotase [Rubeoparvulum massiliense]|uniref:dihydroorotase n=1 Tax=Rubeoparvulum massiliense TaxID=1631346 RepID=UPI00065DDD02|nr:dihydroorotase [Rubeoparvulum massiliense]